MAVGMQLFTSPDLVENHVCGCPPTKGFGSLFHRTKQS